MRKALIVVMVLACTVGCSARRHAATQGEDPSTVAAGAADADRLWTAALETVSVRFPVKSAQRAAGTIETDYVVGPLSQTGFKINSVTREDRAYDTLHTMRRRAVVTVKPQGDKPLTVCVYRQRLARIGSEPLPTGTYSLDLTERRPQAAGERWIDEGRDSALEAVIEKEVAARLAKRPSQH